MKRELKVKVCGMRQSDNIKAVEEAGADLIGFILYDRSPRFVSEVPTYLPTKAERVGVFVDAGEDYIRDMAYNFSLSFVQLHGNETPELCETLREDGLNIIKALPVKSASDLDATKRYEGCCDYLLFDTKCDTYGGSGVTFDWKILDTYRGETPFLLSGGITPDHVESILAITHPLLYGVDLNSGFEIEPALKDAEKIKEFIDKLK